MDRREFDSWVWQAGPALHRTGYLLTGDWGRSRELVVAACARTHADWDRVAAAAPEAHARAVMAREVASGKRRHPMDRATRPSAEVPGQPDRRAQLTQALDALAPPERTVLVLQYYDGLTEDQVASDLAWDVETVSDLTDRALDVLRERGLDDGWGLG